MRRRARFQTFNKRGFGQYDIEIAVVSIAELMDGVVAVVLFGYTIAIPGNSCKGLSSRMAIVEIITIKGDLTAFKELGKTATPATISVAST